MSESNNSNGRSAEEPTKPIFPREAVSPTHEAEPPHPNVEALLNTTAKHVFPAKPTPSDSDAENKKDVSKEGTANQGERAHAGRQKEDLEEGQNPLLVGTPLDELATPMLDKAGSKVDDESNVFDSAMNQSKQGRSIDRPRFHTMSGQSIAIPEDQELHVEQGGKTATATTPTDRRRSATVGNPAPRPNFSDTRDFGSVRMGASALVSALNALAKEEKERGSDSSSDEEPEVRSSHRATEAPAARRPKVSRLHSSLHTIRPKRKQTSGDDQAMLGSELGPNRQESLDFPFRQNTIARRARSPGMGEIEYQLHSSRQTAGQSTSGGDNGTVSQQLDPRRHSVESEASLSIPEGAREVLDDRISKEEALGGSEELSEMRRAAAQDGEYLPDSPSRSDDNTAAALREGSGEDEIVEDNMGSNAQEKKRLRREKLSEKLMDVFGLQEREEVLEEMRCWLLRSVMLKGYMYLTPRHICFFARMPTRENLVVKTGPLSKKSRSTKMNTKFWAVLKNEVLSWFESASDPYFPKGNVSLQYASSCDAIDETRFKLRTSEKNYTFTAESEASRDEWIKAIQKVMFKTQHEGESVKLIIPLEAVLEVDKAPTLEFAETLEIKCVDPEDQMSVDSYFFASFQDSDRALHAIHQTLNERPASELPQVSEELSSEAQAESDAVEAHKKEESEKSGPLGLKKLGSVLKPLLHRSSDNHDESDREGGAKTLSIPFLGHKHKQSNDSMETLRMEASQDIPRRVESDDSDGYPPRQTGDPPSGYNQDGKGGWGWMKKPSKIFGTSPTQVTTLGRSPSGASNKIHKSPKVNMSGLTDSPTRVVGARGARTRGESVTEVVESNQHDDDGDSSDDESDDGRNETANRNARWSFSSSTHSERGGYSMMEHSESAHQEHAKTARKFRKVFALGEKEELIEHFPGYLYRVLPVHGRFFVSSNYLCFRSSQLLYKTKMIIPIRDLYGLKAQKAFRFGHAGLIVVIKGHEELFLEFSSSARRTACVTLLEERMEAVRLASSDPNHQPTQSEMDQVAMRIEEDLDESTPMSPKSSIPPVSPSPMFGSTTSTFLEFKPEPMRITCLTIGSRGDVQPYIALCKGLQAEGHHARIASHGEYKDWVEGHGIEFASVGGDPAELMQMCVDNGMFTISFMKEGLQKFRGWLDDLLQSSWEACQGSDLLIESPSAMGGIHIAEALQIPYYRAFTMPWTRTRAYPHAFAVPEHKKGGAYNYMTYTMFDQVFWTAISGQVNKFRKKVMGIESTNFDKLEQHKVPFLYNFSPNVVPPPLDWTEWIHVTGYWFLENADESASKENDWKPPDGLVEFIDGAHKKGKKVVYIGFGSIVVSDPQEMTRCVVDAVKDSGVCAILSKGWSDRGSKGKDDKDKNGQEAESDDQEREDEDEKDEKEAESKEDGDQEGADGITYPDEIYPIDSIDHSWLFPRIDAACHHGGAGTSGASLRAGIPTIIKPFFGDQAFWSERVESLNVGSAVRKLTAEALCEALKKATTDEKQIAKAKIVGEMIRKENGVMKAIEAIYRDLEYAKSLIKPPPEPHKTHTGSLLAPITSITSDLSLFRSRSGRDSSKNHARDESGDGGQTANTSEDDSSWSVLSNEPAGEQGKETVVASPQQLGKPLA